MATIALYASKINQMPSLIKDVKKSVTDYKAELQSLKKKTLTINKSVCDLDDVISAIQASSQIQEEKLASLESFSQNSENFIADVVRIDSNVADVINQNKNEFYGQFGYLKPESEKGGWEKFCDGCKSVGEWCKENWETIKLVLKAIVVVALVAVSVVLLCTGVGAILTGMALGAIIGAGVGGLSGGIISALNGGSFLAGFINGAFSGAIYGAIGGAIGGGIAGALTKFLGSTATLLGSIAQGGFIGAISGGISSMAVSALGYFVEFGTLSGSLDTIFMNGLTGALIGGAIGGLIGGLQFKFSGKGTDIANTADDATKGADNNFKFGDNVDNHLKNVEKVTGKTVSGGHNLDEFEKALTNLDPNISIDDIIISKKPHPTIPGVYEIEYQLPKQVSGGGISQPIDFKPVNYPKTVYDPSVISDAQMATWGREAMQNGTIVGNKVTGYASNGLKFEGYLRDGEITNFYPTLD